MRFTRGAVAAVLVAGLGGLAALAQPPGGGRGFGFGGGGPAQLINSKTVQKELKIDEEQAGKLKEWAREFGAKQREKMQEAMKDVPMEERFQKIGAIMAELNKDAYKEIGSVLKEEQVKRLKQIEVQVAGTRAFALPNVKEALKINEEQAEKIQDISRSSFKEIAELREEFGLKGFGGPQLEPDKQKEYDKKMAGITKDVMDKIMATMSDEQKKTYKDLTGEAVDVATIQRESMPRFQGKRKKDD
jgi:hypothetical protein